jgi:hypothetical protein
MENIDYKNALLEVISMIRDKATYLKLPDEGRKRKESPEFNEGMAYAYYFVMDGIKTYIECSDEMNLNDFNLEEYNPAEILKYIPES